MARFLVLTSRGLGEPLQEELKEIGIDKSKLQSEGVYFDGSWKDVYAVHLKSHLASRVLLPVLDFKAYNAEDLYSAIFKKHDFTKYITPDRTFAIEAHVTDHKEFRDQRFVALKVKDAIADQFRQKFDRRPDVDAKNPQFRVVVRVVKTDVSVAIDLTGSPLSHRGYRLQAAAAPLRENLAAGLVRLAGWQPEMPIVDPMCGSGTILIEAAMMARNLLADRRKFLFQNLESFQKEAFDQARAQFKRRNPELKLFGFDKDPRVLEQARENAERAGVREWIHFRTSDVLSLKPPIATPGLVISNPPYAVRIETLSSAKALWKDLSQTLKTRFPGWTCWVLSGNKDLTKSFHLKNERRIPIWNGPIECRYLKYPIS